MPDGLFFSPANIKLSGPEHLRLETFQVVVGEAELLGDVVRNVLDDSQIAWSRRLVAVQRLPGLIHDSAVFFRGTPETTVTMHEERLHRCLELIQLGLRSEILCEIRHQPGADPLRQSSLDPICVSYRTLAYIDDISYFHQMGRLCVRTTDLNFPSLAGICGIGSGLEYS